VAKPESFEKIKVEFTEHKINHFEVFGAVIFRTFAMLYNHHFLSNSKTFSSPRKKALYCQEWWFMPVIPALRRLRQ
jgi:hypothetical protein